MQRSLVSEPAIHDDMVAECRGRVILIRCGKSEPSEAAWRGFLNLIRARSEVPLRGVVVTAGGAPSGAQQKSFLQAVTGRTLPFVIMSDDVRVRFVTSMLAMVTKRIRSFALADADAACAYLELSPEECQQVSAFVAAGRAAIATD